MASAAERRWWEVRRNALNILCSSRGRKQRGHVPLEELEYWGEDVIEGRTLSFTESETKIAKGTNQTRRKKIAWAKVFS